MDSFTPPLSAHNAHGGSADQDDPFLWDTETLSRELCSKGRPWLKHPDALAAKLAEEEVDGCTLLTYDFLLSKKELAECLGITTARAKAGLAEAVLTLQAKSKAFRSWKRNMLRNQSQLASDDDEKDKNIKNESSLASVAPQYPGPAPKDSATRSPDRRESSKPDETLLQAHEAAASIENVLFRPDGETLGQLFDGDADCEMKVVNGTTSPLHEPSNDPAPALGDEGRTPKRRRLAPTNLSTKPLPGSDILALKKAGSLNLVDTVKDRSNDGEASHAGTPPEYAYLGDKGRHRKTVLSHFASPDNLGFNLNGDDFTVVSWQYIVPPGQRIVTNSLMKRYLLENSRKEAALNGGTAPDRSSATPSDGSEDVLDLDDLPDSWDEETQREIDEEKAEMAAMERERARNIPIERVESILKDELALMKTKWIEKKLPRYQRKAYQLWMAAKRNQRTMKEQIFGARKDAEHYDRRIKKLYAEIIANTWQVERELRTQACVMEQNLSDKFYSTWLIELLERREAPPKPLDMPKPKAKRPAPKTPRHPFDDEILTSSDEEDFIVPDDDGASDDVIMLDDGDLDQGAPGTPMAHHTREPSHAPSDTESCMKLDLSGLESPEQLRDSKETAVYIDLISPSKSADGEASASKADQPASSSDVLGAVPPMDQLGSLEMIGQHPPQHWARQKDRWRLVLCLLWKLPQIRREWIFRLMQDKTSHDAWHNSVKNCQFIPFEEEDIGKKEIPTVVLDITKLFLSCTQCRRYTDARVMVLDKRDQNRIKRSRAFFPTFHAFIREWAPRFPKSSQIFRTDAFDDELGVDESEDSQLSSTESPSKMRKHAAREIVQNKEGVDLREREKRRAQELEARRVKLRAALATSNAISSDKSRLIINESKQDGQSFIYVNEEIGKRIKDHQINGVRFLWNQIIVDAETRQGCLLAHTMGLGKTMQVITFLVAVLEAANSHDESIRAQIPKDLRKPQTVILCPAGLVDNWLDEILMWSPRGLLGNVLKYESALKGEGVRLAVIKDWERNGGVVVMGHTMFRLLDGNVREILTRSANLVVCDEAHAMKNEESQLHGACKEFRTRSRIALTGSPLSNNVQEYYSMINWVAPNFLGPVQEFRDIYATPIEHGLWKDSTGYQKRRALKLLEVLKMNVAPKVQRATTQVVRHELPAKFEFVIFVEATPLQKRLYDIYLNEMAPTLENAKATRIIGTSQHLALICNHPRCFRQKMVEASRASAAPQPRGSARGEDGKNSAQVTAAPFPRSMISTVLKETIGDIANPTLSRKVELLLMILDEARAIKDKVLLFSHSLLTLDYLEELFKQQRRAVCRLDGSTAVAKRQEQIKAFNTGDSEIYLISTKAGGVGLNIYGANRVVIFDFRWNPVSEQQAVGRAYRFGQEKTVYVYQFVTSGAFEEQLQNKNVFKMQLASRVVDKKNPAIVANKINGLLRPITTKPAKDLSPFINRDRILDKLIEYAQPQGIIREIISTDTFEEEDPTNELTAEERKDAQELHDIERLKNTDPVRYRLMWDQRQRNEQIRASASAMAGRATTAPSSTPRPMQHLYIPPSSAPATVVPSNGNPHLVAPNTVVPSNGKPRPSATVPSTQPPARTQPAAAMPSSSQAQGTPQFPSSAPMPIAGANTYIRKSGDPPFRKSAAYIVSDEDDDIFEPPLTPANMQPRAAVPMWNSGPPNFGQPNPGQQYYGQQYHGQPTRGQQYHGHPNQGQQYHGQAIPGLSNFEQPTSGQSTAGGQATPRQQTPRPGAEPTLTGASLVTSPSGRPSIFSQPRSQAKDEFQIELARLIANLPVFAADHEGLAAKHTAEISEAQRKQALGFLPDNARWRLLLGHIQKHPRFVLAILMGNCTPDYLATAPDDEIETRISVMNDESEVSFLRRLKRCTARADPSNLNNINRPRRFRLPAWGYDALYKLNGPDSNSENPQNPTNP